MNIVLLGYGKMGQLIEKFAVKRGHQVVLVVDKDSYGLEYCINND